MRFVDKFKKLFSGKREDGLIRIYQGILFDPEKAELHLLDFNRTPVPFPFKGAGAMEIKLKAHPETYSFKPLTIIARRIMTAYLKHLTINAEIKRDRKNFCYVIAPKTDADYAMMVMYFNDFLYEEAQNGSGGFVNVSNWSGPVSAAGGGGSGSHATVQAIGGGGGHGGQAIIHNNSGNTVTISPGGINFQSGGAMTIAQQASSQNGQMTQAGHITFSTPVTFTGPVTFSGKSAPVVTVGNGSINSKPSTP